MLGKRIIFFLFSMTESVHGKLSANNTPLPNLRSARENNIYT